MSTLFAFGRRRCMRYALLCIIVDCKCTVVYSIVGDIRQLIFFRKLFNSNNRILRALITLPTVHYEIFGLVSKYGIYTVHYSIASIKTAIWYCFVSQIEF